MANCPHCAVVISQDFLDSVMDELSNYNGVNNFIIERNCPSCNKPIQFQRENLGYTMMQLNGNTTIIGGR